MIFSVANALRFTPPQGKVEVVLDADTDQGRVRLTVRDTGPGIPSEHLPNVFERFYRADKARSRATGGSGIGLAVVKQLVEAHDGQVWAESPTGAGTSFVLVLPASNSEDASLGLPDEQNPDGRLSSTR